MTLSVSELVRGVELFRHLIAEEPGLSADLMASEREYFRGRAPRDDSTPAGRSALHRHLEWFLFERPASGASGRPAEELLGAWRERAGDDLVEGSDSFLNSHASIFEVAEVEGGRATLLRDLAGLGDYPVAEPEACGILDVGDLVVGRLYPVDGAHRISPAAGFFRNQELLAAVERDLGRLREDRRHPVLRVTQPELEAMFWGAPDLRSAPDPVGGARRFLSDSGLDAAEVNGILAELAAEPFDPSSLVHGAADLLGGILERLAFDTAADLERARTVLLGAWARTEVRPEPEAEATDVSAEEEADEDVERAIAEFDRARALGLDLERSFEKLEQSLGLEDQPEAAEESAEEAPDFPGVVGAVIEEFIWEVGRLEGPAAARELERLRILGEFAERIGVIENLSGRDLLGFAGFWLPERRVLGGPEDARRMTSALRRFCAWIEETQSVELLRGFSTVLDGLERSLPRITEANLALSDRLQNGSLAANGQVVELVERGEDGAALIRDRRGIERRVRLSPELGRHLGRGDRMRVKSVQGQDPVVLCVYPPEVASLLRDVGSPEAGEG